MNKKVVSLCSVAEKKKRSGLTLCTAVERKKVIASLCTATEKKWKKFGKSSLVLLLLRSYARKENGKVHCCCS